LRRFSGRALPRRLGRFAQTGALERAVGGYTFEEAAKEAPTTKDFNSA
jgi:hypothetical protein